MVKKKRRPGVHPRKYFPTLVCPFCFYEWRPRVAAVKECPRCKRYLFRRRPGPFG